MSFRGGRNPEGNPNDIKLGDPPRMFGGIDSDKNQMRDDPEDRFQKFDSGRGRRNPLPFGRGRRPSPGRDKPYGDRPRDFGFGRDDPPVRDRSPMHGGPDNDRFKKDDPGLRKREDMGRKDPGRPFYGDEPPRDRFMGMEGRGRFDGPGGFNSRFDNPSEPFKPGHFNYPNLPPKGFMDGGFPKPNECEIIVVNKLQRLYAESVEARVKNLGILVDVLFLKDEAVLAHTVDDIARRGSLYAIVISPQNETHHSVTVNILHGTPQEHRNMPLDDALKLVSRNFHEHIRMQKENMERERAERGPYVGVVVADREIQFLLRMLADGRCISFGEINSVIRYLTERRDSMQGASGDRLPMPAADKIDAPIKRKDDIDITQKEQDLQNRIMNVMNQGAPPANSPDAPRMNQNMMGGGMDMPGQRANHPPPNQASRPGLDNMAAPDDPPYSTGAAEPNATSAYTIPFDNPSVQKALDNLMQSGPSLLKSISMTTTGSANPPQNTVSSAGGLKPADAPNQRPLRGPTTDMGPPRGSGGMMDDGMGPPRGGSGGMPDFGRMGGPQRGGHGGGMPEGGRMGPQGNMGPMGGRGHPPHGMGGPVSNFPGQGQGQFGNYPGPGQQGNFQGPYGGGGGGGSNMMGNMPRQNYGGNQGPPMMGGGPRRY